MKRLSMSCLNSLWHSVYSSLFSSQVASKMMHRSSTNWAIGVTHVGLLRNSTT